MSTIGSPIETSLLQTIQAQREATTRKARERARTDASGRRDDQIDLRTEGVEAEDAVRDLPPNDSEEAREEHQSQPAPNERPRIDLTA